MTRNPALLDVVRGGRCLVEHAAARRGLPEAGQHRQVDAGGEELAQLVEHERRLVGHHRLGRFGPIPAPERAADQVVVLRPRGGRESVEPVAGPLEEDPRGTKEFRPGMKSGGQPHASPRPSCRGVPMKCRIKGKTTAA